MAHFIFAETVFTNSDVLQNKVIECDKGKIVSISDRAGQDISFEYECLAPGFFDVHINGGEWNNFTKSPTLETLRDIDEASFKTGAAYVLPTLISSPMENIFKGIDAVREYKKINPDSGVIGMHLEGPFLNPEKRGAHPGEFLKKPADSELEKIISAGRDVIKMITVAPEMLTDDQILMLRNSGIKISFGHSNATFEQAQHGFGLGVNLVTHLFNAMSPFTHRAPGLVGAIFDHKDVWAPVILDGSHCDFAVARVAYKIKKDKLFLISDALFLSGKVKEFEWGNYDARLVDGKYVNSEGNLTGAVISLADAVKNAVIHLGVTPAEAISMATIRPAKVLGLDNSIGKLQVNYPSVFTVFDSKMENFTAVKIKP